MAKLLPGEKEIFGENSPTAKKILAIREYRLKNRAVLDRINEIADFCACDAPDYQGCAPGVWRAAAIRGWAFEEPLPQYDGTFPSQWRRRVCARFTALADLEPWGPYVNAQSVVRDLIELEQAEER